MGAIVRNGEIYGSNMAINDAQTSANTTWSSEKVDTKISANKCLVITKAAFSSLPQTITDSRITSDMVVINSVLGTPSAQTGDWTVETSNGSLTVSGTISGSTTLTLYLINQQ